MVQEYELVSKDDQDHAAALEQTGFWGARGSGCIVFARDTERFLFGLRSEDVLEPHTWGSWGGAVPKGVTSRENVIIELLEETEFNDEIELIPIYRFEDKDTGFVYENFIGIVETEFSPNLNWEHSDFKWVTSGDWPSPMHFGLQKLFENIPDLLAVISDAYKIGRCSP